LLNHFRRSSYQKRRAVQTASAKSTAPQTEIRGGREEMAIIRPGFGFAEILRRLPHFPCEEKHQVAT
jgi:hypothetical protein